jgi:hypothetical protein
MRTVPRLNAPETVVIWHRQGSAGRNLDLPHRGSPQDETPHQDRNAAARRDPLRAALHHRLAVPAADVVEGNTRNGREIFIAPIRSPISYAVALHARTLGLGLGAAERPGVVASDATSP